MSAGRAGDRDMSRDPLRGRTILLTRPAERADPLARALRARGSKPLAAPTIRIVGAASAAMRREAEHLADERFDWLILTSAATVDALRGSGLSARDVRAKVAVIGDATAEALTRWTRRPPDLQPRTFTTEALARAFPRGSGRVFLPRADVAPEGLEDALRTKGWKVKRLTAYRTVPARSLPTAARAALRAGTVDAITFTSASTVRGFVTALGTNVVKGSPKVVCIGPVTSREARARGLPVHAVARPHTMEGLIRALERALS